METPPLWSSRAGSRLAEALGFERVVPAGGRRPAARLAARRGIAARGRDRHRRRGRRGLDRVGASAADAVLHRRGRARLAARARSALRRRPERDRPRRLVAGDRCRRGAVRPPLRRRRHAKDDVDAMVGLLAPGGTAVLDDFWLDPALPDPRRDAWLQPPAADRDRALGDAASGAPSSRCAGSPSGSEVRPADSKPVVTWPHSVDDIGGFLITWLPIIFFGIIIWLLLRTMSLVPKVKPAMVDRDTTDPVGWDDVAGADEAKEELKEVVEFLRDRKKFERLGARVPKGVLLYGPPGTGKTLLAKAAANESGANFYSSSASAFVEMFAGLGAARIRKLFEEARKNAPAIIFIDELDAVGTRPLGRRAQPRARPDAQPAARRAGRLRRRRRGRDHGRLEPAPGSRPCPAAPGPLRPPGQRRPARPARAARRSSRCTRARSRSAPTSTSPSSRVARPASPAPTSRTSRTRQRSSRPATTSSTSARRTSRARWSAC